MWERKELKQRGKAAFKANYWKTVLVAFLLALFVAGGSASASRYTKNSDLNVSSQNGEFTVNGQTYDNIQDAITAIGEAEDINPEDVQELNDVITQIQTDPEAQAIAVALVLAVVGIVLVIVLVGSLLRIFVFGPLEVGCQGFFARNAEGPAELSELGSGFHPYWRTVGAMFLRDLFLCLWSLLFVIPGIIKAYSYRMTPYILAENPEMSGKEAITLSRQMMDGQKWKTFVLDLSFIGWGLLSALTLGILGIFYVHPYRYCTNAELYQELKAQM